MVDMLTANAVACVRSEDWGNDPITLQIGGLKPFKDKYHARFTDGKAVIDGIIATQVSKRVAAGEISDLDVLQLTGYQCNLVGGTHKLIATQVEIVARNQPPFHKEMGSGPPTDATNAAVKAEPVSPVTLKPAKAESDVSTSTPGPVIQAKENASPMETDGGAAATPAAAPKHSAVPKHLFQTPGPAPSPSEEVKKGTAPGTVRRMPPTPGSARKGVQPIAALNPYNMQWTIKARVTNKAPLRKFNRDGGEKSVFSIEIVDDGGTSIEATLWGEFADQHHDKLEEGKVYYISRGKVKPANRNYAAVRNDYTINLDNGSEIEECEDQNTSGMEARPSFVPIDQLPGFVGKKALVDLLGVVTTVGQLGSVKRKSDQSELQRRDLTLLDQSRKTVRLTLWGALAENLAQLEGQDAPLVSVTACRVTDFDGVSVSSLSRSVVRTEPTDYPEAVKLRDWYEAEGRGAATSAVGEGLATARGSGGPVQRTTLRGLQKEQSQMPAPDAKPEYFTVSGTVTFINPDQSMYYMAAPENNRKVTPAGDGYFCEFDGKTYDRMERRYILLVKAADASGEAYINMFNEQAVELLGMNADGLANLKEGGDTGAYTAALKSACWSDWTFRIQTRTREYNGELRQRFNVQNMQRMDYAAESAHLLEQISRMTAAAA